MTLPVARGCCVTSRLATLPWIDVVQLAQVNAVPSFHPEHDTFRPFPVHAFVVHHPNGPIIVDTGIGFGNDLIDALYPHTSQRLLDELHLHGIDERQVPCVIDSHLHFDNCGQNPALSCPVVVQRAEIHAARQPHYTVPEWADTPPSRSLVLDGDTDVATGVTAMLTPGHTPGHQAVVIRGGEDVVVIAAQCIFRQTAWQLEPEVANLHDHTWAQAANDSLARLRALRPQRVLLSHDAPFEATQPQADTELRDR